MMNYYGSEKYKENMKKLDEQLFSRIRFDRPEREKDLESGYLVRYYYYEDKENCKPGYAPAAGEICRLLKDNKLLFEWKNTDGNSRMACITHHADGNTYFVFDEDLYGYSVLNLDSLQCMHFIPAESYETCPDAFRETFIWCECHYNPENNLLAVNGCFWACPGDVIVLDFKNPMIAVESKDWSSVYGECGCDDSKPDNIDFDSWDKDTLVCKANGAIPAAFVLEGKCKVRFV